MAETSRRAAIALGLTLVAAPAAADTDAAASAEAALRACLQSFANCDLPAMEAAFAVDSTNFPGLYAGPRQEVPPLDSLKRAAGMPDGMRRLAETLPKTKPGPPYHRPDLIRDLLVQVEGNVAICTFHFLEPDRIGRRTIVLVRRAGTWRILHLHASNLVL
jgi:hypothetical protein